ncbi:hypothetical protein TNCV_4589911 [Trichonephila clavipes]|nr:hypothetical protein TNCV_4589911 [Trichonephila clavipes]
MTRSLDERFKELRKVIRFWEGEELKGYRLLKYIVELLYYPLQVLWAYNMLINVVNLEKKDLGLGFRNDRNTLESRESH